MNEWEQTVEEVFGRALEIAAPAARLAYIEEACAGDDALRREVESLLRAHLEGDGFIDEFVSLPTRMEVRGLGPQPRIAQGEQPGDYIGSYKLLERIGEGGMGSVWMADQQQPIRRRVALKVIKFGMDTREVVARFEAERQALALMDHPNIARVFDGGSTASGRPYFVMELVRGTRLTDYCDQHRLSTGERLELFKHVCQAVQHAHQKGIIHRDLKPSNVLVTLHDGVPVPKVIDFGIAKATGQRLTDKTLFTRFYEMLGTPAYMSPEQAEMSGLDVDTRSDVYALGVLLYELLTGRTPFDSNELLQVGLDEMRRTIREREPVRPSTRLRALELKDLTTAAQRRQTEAPLLIELLSGDLDWIVMKCLEKDRTRRYESAGNLAQDLQRHLQHEPVLARPPSARYRWEKFFRKHRLAVLVSGAFALLLIVGAGLSLGLALWANRERQAAVNARNAESTQRGRAESAETQARKNEQQARASEAEARAVLRFLLEKLLAAARPEGQEGGLGHNVTLRAAVEASEIELIASFTNQPLVEAAIRDVLGRTYFFLGDYPRSASHHERALALRQEWLAPADTNLLDSLNHLGLTYEASDRTTNAIELLEQALVRARTSLGSNHDTTRTLLGNLAVAHYKVGRRSEAVAMLEEVLRAARASLPADDDGLLSAVNNLAEGYRDGGRVAEAVVLLEEAFRGRRSKLGPGHPTTLLTMRNLGNAYREAGRLSEAISLLQENLKICLAKLSPDHPDTLGARDGLGVAYVEADQLTNALPLLREGLDLAQAKLGPTHRLTLRSLNNLANALIAAGRFAEALPLCEEALEKYRTALGSAHPETLVLMSNLAASYRKTGRTDEAVRLLEECLELERQQRGPDQRNTLRAMSNLAVIYREVGRLSNSVPLAEEVLRRARSRPDPGQPLALWARNLALCYQDLRRMSEAIPLFEEAVLVFRRDLGPDHSETLRALLDLALAFHLAEQFSSAEPHWRARLAAQQAKGPDHDLALAETKSWLGECLLRQDKFAEAEPWLRQSSTAFEQRQAGSSAALTVLAQLGWSLFGQKRYAEAEPLLLQALEGLQRRQTRRVSTTRARLVQETTRRLADLYRGWGKPEKAAKWENSSSDQADAQRANNN